MCFSLPIVESKMLIWHENLFLLIALVAVRSSDNLVMRCCVPHITVPVVDEIWPRTVLCTIFVNNTAVELQNSVLLFIIMNAKHSWHDIFCWALEEELLVIMVHVASLVALRHWSIDNSFSLPQPLTVSLWLLCYFALCTRLHHDICCIWHGGDHPSHSGMLLVLLSVQREDHKYTNSDRWPEERKQVYPVIYMEQNFSQSG